MAAGLFPILLTSQALHSLPPHLRHPLQQNAPPKSIKNKTHTHKSHLAPLSFQQALSLFTLAARGVRQCTPLVQLATPAKTFIAMCHWSASRPLARHHHCALTETPLGCPAVAPSHSDPAVIVPQDQSLPSVQS